MTTTPSAVRLGLLAEVVSGSGFPDKYQGRTGLELPFYKVSSLSSIVDGAVTGVGHSVTRETARELGARIIPPGGVMMAKIGAALMLGRYAQTSRPACIDNNMQALIPRDGINSRYLLYAMTQVPLPALVKDGPVPTVDVMGLKMSRIPHHDVATQQRIADYLDRETGEIDVMIAKMDMLSGQLEERRSASWSLGIKQAYELGRSAKLSMLVESIADGPFGSSLTSSHYSDVGTRVIRLGNIGINSFRGDDKAFIPTAYAETLATHAVEQGDVVVAGLGDERWPLGRAAVVPDIGPAIVKADCYRVRPNSLVSAEYLAWALSSPHVRAQAQVLSRGATRARLNTKVVQEVEIPLISPQHQAELLRRQSQATSRIDTMLAKVAELKSLLTERRAALITDVVTGRKEVA